MPWNQVNLLGIDSQGGYTTGTQGSRKRPFITNIDRDADPCERTILSYDHQQSTVG